MDKANLELAGHRRTGSVALVESRPTIEILATCEVHREAAGAQCRAPRACRRGPWRTMWSESLRQRWLDSQLEHSSASHHRKRHRAGDPQACEQPVQVVYARH